MTRSKTKTKKENVKGGELRGVTSKKKPSTNAALSIENLRKRNKITRTKRNAEGTSGRGGGGEARKR